MPIKIPRGLPAKNILNEENIFTINEVRAKAQDIRPLKIAILNLMPNKEVTETQLIRLLSNTPLQIELTLLRCASHRSKNTSEEYLASFYKFFHEVKDEKFDGLIITGAPVENLDFKDVTYWEELCEIMDWSKTNVFSTLHICWAAQAGLFYHHGIKKYPLKKKLSGVYRHKVNLATHPLVRGFDEEFSAPHSRYTEIKMQDINACDDVQLIASSKQAGAYIIGSSNMRMFFVTGHCEYDWDTLKGEYLRDLKKGIDPDIPENYFPDNDPTKRPKNLWRGHAHLLFSNWLNYFVYQMTPFDLEELL